MVSMLYDVSLLYKVVSLNFSLLYLLIVHWERRNKVRTGTEAFEPLTMHRRNTQDHCILRTRQLHVLKLNRIITRAYTCNTHACDQQGHYEYYTRVQVPRSIDQNNTNARIKKI